MHAASTMQRFDFLWRAANWRLIFDAVLSKKFAVVIALRVTNIGSFRDPLIKVKLTSSGL